VAVTVAVVAASVSSGPSSVARYSAVSSLRRWQASRAATGTSPTRRYPLASECRPVSAVAPPPLLPLPGALLVSFHPPSLIMNCGVPPMLNWVIT
jgi:hypothetical protein